MRNIGRAALLLALVLLTTSCSSLNVDSISNMLVTFSSNFPQIKKFIFGFSYLGGFWLVISALQKFRMLSNPNAASMGQQTQRGAIIQLFLGAILLALPSFITMLLYSLWGTGTIMSSSGFSTGVLSVSVEKAIVGLIQLMGYISVVRGLMILNKVAHQQASQDTFGKGIMHIIGGILAINIMKTVEMIKASFGL
jgi:intracellular multiplication protein IcmC